jgi:hypothetical protein
MFLNIQQQYMLRPVVCLPCSHLTTGPRQNACAVYVQAAVSNAEQQVASLEVALQKGSQVTLSMTEKVAQTLAASNAQVEALKVGLRGQGGVTTRCGNMFVLVCVLPMKPACTCAWMQGLKGDAHDSPARRA